MPYIPENGYITSISGYRKHPLTGELKGHGGVDVGIPLHDPLFAIADGRVVAAKKSGKGEKGYVQDPKYGRIARDGFGLLVIVKHTMNNNKGKSKTFYTWYGHCQDMLVKKDDIVTKGQTIATCGSRGGSSGPHLHFEVHMNSSGGPREKPISIFGWYPKVRFKRESEKNRWKSENPELAIQTTSPTEITPPALQGQASTP